MKKTLIAAAVAASAFLAVSCASSSINIDGEWNVVSVDGVAVPDSLEQAPLICFDSAKKTYHARPGINLVNGSYTLEGDKLTFGEGAMTRMAGPVELMNLESSIVNNMFLPLTVKLEGDTMNLCNDEGVAILVLKK